MRTAVIRGSLLLNSTSSSYSRLPTASSFRRAPLRLFSTPSTASPEALQAAEELLARWPSSQPASVRQQRLDAHQVQVLRSLLEPMQPLTSDPRATLRALDAAPPPPGTPLLPMEHLVFFNPHSPSETLGADGSDTAFNPPGGVFTRRMWAGGQLHFHTSNPLRVGDEATQTTYIDHVDIKHRPHGKGEMIVVTVRNEIANQAGVALTDQRSWLYQRALTSPDPPPPVDLVAETACHAAPDLPASSSPLPAPTRQQRTPAELFRYSALTYNAHAIHLDQHWARHVEGHASTVVHGPLNISLLARKWLADHQAAETGAEVRSLRYRATSPVCAGMTYWLRSADKNKDGLDVVQAVRPDGRVIMEAVIGSS